MSTTNVPGIKIVTRARWRSDLKRSLMSIFSVMHAVEYINPVFGRPKIQRHANKYCRQRVIKY